MYSKDTGPILLDWVMTGERKAQGARAVHLHVVRMQVNGHGVLARQFGECFDVVD